MPYYPKTKIQTNLFSNGELIKSSDFSDYIGPYYKLSTGEKYVGKDPQAFRYPELLLDPISVTATQGISTSPLITQRQPAFTTLTGSGNYYENLKEDYTPKKVPVPFYPQPTDQDYQVGYFTRYFAKKANSINYTEINQSTFKNLSSHNGEYLWKLYKTTSLPWQISGDIEKVFNTNKNIIKLEEKNGFSGLSRFLKEDYIKFYQK
jgi:hypothetical protein